VERLCIELVITSETQNRTNKTGNLHIISATSEWRGQTNPQEENAAGRTMGPARSGREGRAPLPARVATREGLGEAPLVLAAMAEKEDLMDREARRDSIKRRGRDGSRMGIGDVGMGTGTRPSRRWVSSTLLGWWSQRR
jgi:hypothetical protein